MSGELSSSNGNNNSNYGGNNWEEQLRRYIGETVTIFTTSGGESGLGFTGVVISVNCNFVRLITQIGIAPSCPLGSACSCFSEGNVGGQSNGNTNSNCNGNNFGRGLGSVTDIPIRAIAAFVHNAVSGSY